MTKNDIKPRFLFILDMYGATEKFVKNFNNRWANPDVEIRTYDHITDFNIFIGCAFTWPNNEVLFWDAVARQNESLIKQFQI